METIYIIEDKEKYAWAAAYEIEEAVRLCKEKEGSTYRLVPFFKCAGTEIEIKAGPIPKEYFPNSIAPKEIAYFKRIQRDNIFHYYEVHGGPGKNKKGYQVVINFLGAFPIISTEHNYELDPSGLTGAWCQYEVGIPITKEEYLEAFKKASTHPEVSFR